MVYVIQASYGEFCEDSQEVIVGVFGSLEDAQHALDEMDVCEHFGYDSLEDAEEDAFDMWVSEFPLGAICGGGHVVAYWESGLDD